MQYSKVRLHPADLVSYKSIISAIGKRFFDAQLSFSGQFADLELNVLVERRIALVKSRFNTNYALVVFNGDFFYLRSIWNVACRQNLIILSIKELEPKQTELQSVTVVVEHLDFLDHAARRLNERFEHAHACLQWRPPAIVEHKIESVQEFVTINANNLDITQIFTLIFCQADCLRQIRVSWPIKFKSIITVGI